MIKTKMDARLEAARLTIESEAESFTGRATEIYNFLIAGIELPDKEPVEDVCATFGEMLKNYTSKMEGCSPKEVTEKAITAKEEEDE